MLALKRYFFCLLFQSKYRFAQILGKNTLSVWNLWRQLADSGLGEQKTDENSLFIFIYVRKSVENIVMREIGHFDQHVILTNLKTLKLDILTKRNKLPQIHPRYNL